MLNPAQGLTNYIPGKPEEHARTTPPLAAPQPIVGRSSGLVGCPFTTRTSPRCPVHDGRVKRGSDASWRTQTSNRRCNPKVVSCKPNNRYKRKDLVTLKTSLLHPAPSSHETPAANPREDPHRTENPTTQGFTDIVLRAPRSPCSASSLGQLRERKLIARASWSSCPSCTVPYRVCKTCAVSRSAIHNPVPHV